MPSRMLEPKTRSSAGVWLGSRSLWSGNQGGSAPSGPKSRHQGSCVSWQNPLGVKPGGREEAELWREGQSGQRLRSSREEPPSAPITQLLPF